MEGEAVDTGGDKRRSHRRYTMSQPCRAIFGGREYRCRVMNMSVAGARIVFDMKVAEHPFTLEVQPPRGSLVELLLEGIGRLKTKVVWQDLAGVAVEFDLDQEEDKRLVDSFRGVLEEFEKREGGPDG